MFKLQKQDLDFPDIFFKIDINILESTLSLEKQGRKHKIMKKIRKIKEEYDREGEIIYVDRGLLDGSPVLKRKIHSHSKAERETRLLNLL